MKIYLAGPDVFRPDAEDWANQARKLCRQYGCEALTPLDHGATTPATICAGNLALIRTADALVANLNPFRGAEPDSGTVFELGYAVALGKPVHGYLNDMEILRARVNRLEHADPARSHDDRGMAIEDFALPLNLMIAASARIVAGGLADCLQSLRDALPAEPTGTDPRERLAHEAAIRYLRWAEEGRIADRTPLATIAHQFKVDEATVQQWVAAWSGIALPAAEGYLPEDVIRKMKISGRQFRHLS
ncbi:MAG: nucleoside 2-deoxyribosyltransferase [Rhodocyclaceae bacterium]|nr:nucleoside 2-deoxyribosyltransferase [Rhodocyclaceae bacterium]